MRHSAPTAPAAPRRTTGGALLLVLLVTAGLLVGCSTSGDVSPGPSPRPAAAPGAPNIVLLMTDDLSLAEMRYLPRTRHLLGDHGVTFSDFTAPQPLCCPSRAQLLTGQYAQNNGVRYNTGPEGGYQAFHPDTALPVWLQAAGYRTAMVGKYLNGYPVHAPHEVGWDHWDPTVQRIYNYRGYTQDTDGHLHRPAAYHTDYVARQSERLIGRLSRSATGDGGDHPFFLWSSFVAPHGICRVSQEAGRCDAPPIPAARDAGDHAGQRGLTLGLPSFNEPDVSDKPAFLARRPPVDVRAVQHLETRRADTLGAVDDAVAGIVGALRRAHQLRNTLIVFTSDNGYLMGQHRYVGKILGYEESVRVPLLARGLGLPAGVTDQDTAAMIDLAPTFATVAHARPLLDVDGQPLVVRDALAGAPPDRTLLLQAGVDNLRKYPSGWWFRGVRTRRYTYIAWTRGFRELYDRHRDPYEDHNVAGEPGYRRAQAELDRRTRLLGACAGATCRTPFGPVPRPGRVEHHPASE